MKVCFERMKDAWVPWVVLGSAFGTLLMAVT